MDPLAINADGVAYRPGSVSEAVALVRLLQGNGARYIDVGCLQIDLFYHSGAFPHLEDAFEPAANTEYGARLLAAGRVDHGDWVSAAAYYHSGDPGRQAEYLRRIAAHWAIAGMGGALPRSEPRAGLSLPSRRMVTVRLSFMTVSRAADSGHSARGRR